MSDEIQGLPIKTIRGLPVVSENTIRSLSQSDKTVEQRWGERLEEVKMRLIKEQPVLVEFLESQVGKFPLEIHDALFEIGIGVYSILEQEANSNRLSAMLKISGESKEGQ